MTIVWNQWRCKVFTVQRLLLVSVSKTSDVYSFKTIDQLLKRKSRNSKYLSKPTTMDVPRVIFDTRLYVFGIPTSRSTILVLLGYGVHEMGKSFSHQVQPNNSPKSQYTFFFFSNPRVDKLICCAIFNLSWKKFCTWYYSLLLEILCQSFS